ncbi:MAG: sugar phosphate isomerase/epimerase family protein [Candidatus Methylacidiphilales bacterium]|nr:sugar phosphate isomerase/epimerase [Candidatus Methylacidiphilales bacterium]
MKISQVAIQLYTLRDFIKTPAEIAATLKKVREIGYEAVQVSGMGPIPEEELVAILKDNGLVCAATHENGNTIRKNPQAVSERLAKLGTRYTAYPYPADVVFDDPASVDSLIADLDKAGEVLAAAGQVLTYHNHATEFAIVNGKTLLEKIYDETNPKFLQGEIDTFWVQYGGGDNVAWCNKLKGRLPLLHAKDFAFPVGADRGKFAEVGYGNLDWKAIVPAAEAAGMEWFIIEQDSCPGDPFDSIKLSFDYTRDNLCS